MDAKDFDDFISESFFQCSHGFSIWLESLVAGRIHQHDHIFDNTALALDVMGQFGKGSAQISDVVNQNVFSPDLC